MQQTDMGRGNVSNKAILCIPDIILFYFYCFIYSTLSLSFILSCFLLLTFKVNYYNHMSSFISIYLLFIFIVLFI